ncbi:MAG TPA: hypothetical protein VE010_18465, partial [Thermoanaerobaculia bacterium]|nr:hypothetical protein [Thermoanaerobaculia bacterium]
MALVLISFGTMAEASVYIVPSDEELTRAAHAIVIGRVVSQRAIVGEGGDIYTVTRLQPEVPLKG